MPSGEYQPGDTPAKGHERRAVVQGGLPFSLDLNKCLTLEGIGRSTTAEKDYVSVARLLKYSKWFLSVCALDVNLTDPRLAFLFDAVVTSDVIQHIKLQKCRLTEEQVEKIKAFGPAGKLVIQ